MKSNSQTSPQVLHISRDLKNAMCTKLGCLENQVSPAQNPWISLPLKGAVSAWQGFSSPVDLSVSSERWGCLRIKNPSDPSDDPHRLFPTQRGKEFWQKTLPHLVFIIISIRRIWYGKLFLEKKLIFPRKSNPQHLRESGVTPLMAKSIAKNVNLFFWPPPRPQIWRLSFL